MDRDEYEDDWSESESLDPITVIEVISHDQIIQPELPDDDQDLYTAPLYHSNQALSYLGKNS